MGVKNGCEMYSAATPGTPYLFFKGINIVPAPVKVVEEAMRQIENMKVCGPQTTNHKPTPLMRTLPLVLTVAVRLCL